MSPVRVIAEPGSLACAMVSSGPLAAAGEPSRASSIKQVDLSQRKARELNLHVEIDQGLELDGKHLPIPAGIQRELVVRDHVGSALCLAEMRQADRWDPLEPQELRRFDPPMAGDDLMLVANEDGIGEAKPLDAGRNLLELPLGMGPGIASVRTKRTGADVLEVHAEVDCCSFHVENDASGRAAPVGTVEVGLLLVVVFSNEAARLAGDGAVAHKAGPGTRGEVGVCSRASVPNQNAPQPVGSGRRIPSRTG